MTRSSNSICIVDDNPVALAQMRLVLERAGMSDIETFCDPLEALRRFEKQPPGVLLVDFLMPRMDGLQLLSAMREAGIGAGVPIAMITAVPDWQSIKIDAYSDGALEIMPKPIDPKELSLKVRNMSRLARGLAVDEARCLSSTQGDSLPTAMMAQHEGPAAVEVTAQPIRLLASDAILRMLDRVATMRDENTGRHTQRMAHYAAAIARAYGVGPLQQEMLLKAAPLHDLGKIGIPDSILLKPGKLTSEELWIMQRHTTIGYELLRDEEGPELQLAAEIALAHHERWDGTGYPLGLDGEKIPLSARIVAVADAFDAITTARPYKPAWLVERAIRVIAADAGNHFDPDVIHAFHRAMGEILRIKQHFDGGEGYIPLADLPH
jgi:putative two-component system response regulator